MSWPRVLAIIRKDLAEFAALRAMWLGPVAMMLLAVLLPLVLLAWSNTWEDALTEVTGDVAELARVGLGSAGARLDDEAMAQVFLLHRFLPLLALVPVIGALTLVTTSIVGEKQARTLEPLLATPITSAELLTAKVLLAFALAKILGAVGFVLLTAGAAVIGRPGVAATFFAVPPLMLVWTVGPTASLLTLVLGAIVSTRARDARAAQQVGAVVVAPFVAVFMGGLSSGSVLGVGTLLGVTVVLLALTAALAVFAVRRFDRERMLTDWR